jgi:RNA polymerase sigma factor (sigma-70 family)
MPRPTDGSPLDTTRKGLDHQPAISWDIARIVSVARKAHRVLEEVSDVSVATIVTEIDGVLQTHTSGHAPRVRVMELVIAETCAIIEQHAHAAPRARRVAAKRLVSDVHSGAVAKQLTESWNKVRLPGKLEDTLRRCAREGVDSEALCWALIGFEAQHHIGLIWHEAHKLCKRIPDCVPEDLFGWGWLGMRVAMRNFDPALGYRFATYACQRVSGAMRDGVRSEHPLPKRLTTLQRKLSRAEDELAAELGRAATLSELAERIGERLEVLEIAPRLQSAASIEELQSASERTGEGMWLADRTDPADTALSAIKSAALREAIASLDADEAEAVRLLYWEGLSVPEAREVTGATARQLRARAARGRDALAEVLSDWR